MAEETTDPSEKTEEPTQRKLEEARKKGDVFKSQEVNSWFITMASVVVISFFVISAGRDFGINLSSLFIHAHHIPLDGNGVLFLWQNLGMSVALIVGLPMLCFVVAGVAGNLIQHQLIWSFDPVKPKLSKISPFSGLKRLFSKQALINFAKGLLKLGAMSTIMIGVIWPYRDSLMQSVHMDVVDILPIMHSFSYRITLAVLAFMSLIAIGDYIWQRHSWMQKQKMSLREIKEEFKQSEGDPVVRSRIREIRMQRGRKRIMQEVPQATVVIVNPTHYSVALKYEEDMPAPVCVAKGVDHLALLIRERAVAADVPIVENPPLARSLYASVKIDDEIPTEHYKAVAQVIRYVMQLKQGRVWRQSKLD